MIAMPQWLPHSSPITPDDFTGNGSSWPCILILSASIGSGHTRAAQAIESALVRILPDATIANVDVLELTNAAFRGVYRAGYLRAIKLAPRLVGWMSEFLDHPGDGGSARSARQFFEAMNFKRLKRLLIDQHWDIAICTHFLPAAFISRLRRRNLIQFPNAAVVTDFDVHGLWINQPCERFFVANDKSRAKLAAVGIENAIVTGVPIDPIFAQRRNRHDAIERMGLAGDRPIVLQMAGGFGIGSVERIHQAICEIERPLQIVVVTGTNAEAARTLKLMQGYPHHSRHILGYTQQMHELLLAADVIVSKPGGLTSAESLACGCPMVVVEPIPGHEDRNADFLLESGCAIRVNNLASLTYKLGSLLEDPQRLSKMRSAALRSSRPRAAFCIAASCSKLLHLREADQFGFHNA
jgi:processive 1,2-diacylglycerol beta-glucosyltransferase